MKQFLRLLTPMRLLPVLLIAMAALTACIENDIPYPRIQANILTLNIADQVAGTRIDSVNRTVEVFLAEDADIHAVQVDSFTLTPGAYIIDNPLGAPVDLSEPLTLNVRLYQTYPWVLSCTQDIERYFSIVGQIGTSIIDAPGHRIIVDVTDRADLHNLTVESIRLGADVATLTPDIKAGSVIDLSQPLQITVTTFGRPVVWTIYARTVQATVFTDRVDAWTCVAWVYATAEAGKNNGIQYRLAGTEQWTDLTADEITVNGGSLTGCIAHLSPQTTYETRAFSDTEYGQTLTFTTGQIVQVPNASLDQWWLNGKVWCPWPEDGEQYWDTGNKGATTLGTSNSMPTDDTSTGTGWAAMLETRFVGIGSIGKLAAGNLFVGRYVRTDGTNGVLSFGREFSQRPTRLRGYLKYKCTNISHSSADYKYLIGQPDTCIVWCALIDSPEPFEIRTNPRDPNLFDPSGPEVVAYGKIQFGETVSEYIPFEFRLEYTSTGRVPRYILITASASKYGDFFTGGAGSTLFLDDLELLYDY